MDIAQLFLKMKPVMTMVYLRDRTKKWNVLALSKKVDATYPYMLNLVKELEKKGLVKTKLSGRSRYVELTDKGDELALALEGFFKVLDRIK